MPFQGEGPGVLPGETARWCLDGAVREATPGRHPRLAVKRRFSVNEKRVRGDVGIAMGRCRQRLDQLDTAMISVIAERMRLCAEIANLKCQGNIPVIQRRRLDFVRAKSVNQGRSLGLEDAFVERLMDLITRESCRLEDAIIADELTHR